MKEKANIKTKIGVIAIIILTLLIIGIISMPDILDRMGLQIGKKEGQEAQAGQVLSGKTFTSSVAGVGAAGAMADYTKNLQTAVVGASQTGVSTINVPAGYYEQIQVDASAVYERGIQVGQAQATSDLQNIKQEILSTMYPVGSIYISTSSTNPSTLFGGTWEAYGQGRTIIGAGTGTDTNSNSLSFTADSTGGEYTHTLSANEMPSHVHWGLYWSSYGVSFSPGTTSTYYITPSGGVSDYKGANNVFRTGSAGGDQAHNNLQPYIVTYMWKRTA